MVVDKRILAVTGMHCASCGLLIDEALEDLPGVLASSTDMRRAMTTVEYDPDQTSLEVITAEIAGLGYATHPADIPPESPPRRVTLAEGERRRRPATSRQCVIGY